MVETSLSRASASTALFKQYIPIAISVSTVLILLFSVSTDNIQFYFLWSEGEGSIVEIFTVILALIGVVLSLNTFLKRKPMPTALIGPWMIFFIIGFLYIALEESSWGQHLFGWQTPDWLSGINRQQETNIHNLFDKRIDRIPKSIIGGLIFIGGVVWPLYCKYKGTPKNLPLWFTTLWPAKTTFTAALCFFLIWVSGRSMVITDFDTYNGQKISFSELRELLITYFLLVYTWDLRRLRRNPVAIPE